MLYELKRPLLFLAALGMLFSLSSGVVFAAANGGQVQFRAIRMSDSGVSGGAVTSGVGSGTNVTYRVTFRAATSYTLRGLVVDFCDGTGTPFMEDANCPAPAGFSVGASPVIDTSDFTESSGTTSGLGAGWTAATAASTTAGQTLVITNATGVALTAGTDYTFAVSGVTNPSTLGTFYARLLTYVSDSGLVSGYTHDGTGTYQDFGGFALSTTQAVQVTAKVQESLTFCVSGTTNPDPLVLDPPIDCTATGVPAIVLGHGTNRTLDSTAVDTNKIWTHTSTNAINGVTIRMKAANTCGGLSSDGGVTCPIPAVGSGSGVPTAMTAGTAAFGMFCINSTGGLGASIDCDDNYRDAAEINVTAPNIWYGMDTTTAGENVTSIYGDVIARSTGPVNGGLNEYLFAATAGNTTPAGVYRTNLAMIATGSF